MERTVSPDLLRAKLAESITAPPRNLTRRDVRLPSISGKPLAVIGVRRGGKTSFLHQRRVARVSEGRPLESQLLLGLEDERLVGVTARDLGWLIDEHARQFPAIRSSGQLSLYLDEIQVVEGWESLIHRLSEAGDVEVIVSGSSAKLLSQEVATAARGRLLEVLVHPFSFREALRHAGTEPRGPWDTLSPTERASVDAALRDFLHGGGFPEAQGALPRDRARLLTGYVDTMVLRDVIERHRVTNPTALRALQRHLLARSGGQFTVNKFFQFLKSQGVPIGKDTLHSYLDHLQDAFLVRLLDMHSGSERQRMVNPRKVYPIDTGLIPLYEQPGRSHRGRTLEAAVLLELERRDYTVAWLRVEEEREVDFFAVQPGEPPLLVQVCLELDDDTTWEREVRSLASASAAYPEARAILITQNHAPPAQRLPGRLEWMCAAQWFLE